MNDLLEKRLIFVTGKGGVGKSTVAMALGLASANAGRRTIICEVGAQERVARTFGHEAAGFEETRLAKNLFGISIDPDESMREYVLLQLRVKAARDLLFKSRIFTYLAAATPGLRELVTIGKIWELTLDERKTKGAERYDTVIVDAPATGHGVGFLQTPRTFAAVARVGPIKSQAETLDKFVTNPKKTGVAIVALPEEMPVNETASLRSSLVDDVGIAVDRIYMNGLYPQRFTDDEIERISASCEAEESGVRAACRTALSEHRRAGSQREQLERLEGMIPDEVTPLPFLFEPLLGTEQIGELAEMVAV